MGAFVEDYLVVKDGRLCPQIARGTVALVWVVSCRRVMRYGIVPSHYHFFTMLKKYNPDTCTLFTPIGKMGFTLHEMFEVFGLPMGDFLYKEYIFSTK